MECGGEDVGIYVVRYEVYVVEVVMGEFVVEFGGG